MKKKTLKKYIEFISLIEETSELTEKEKDFIASAFLYSEEDEESN